VPSTMDRSGLELPPKGAKPYRDCLDKTFIKEKDPKCAAAHFTMTTLNKAVGDIELVAFTPTFGMRLNRHFREEEQTIMISGVVNDILMTAMLTAHQKKAKTRAVEAAMISYKANKSKFEGQAPSKDDAAAIDKFISRVLALIGRC
jgi:hypothetical protein